MDIKLITIQVARDNNRTMGFGYDVSLYESEENMWNNMTDEFSDGFSDDTEYASITYKLNNETVGTFMINTELSGAELVDFIKSGIESAN